MLPFLNPKKAASVIIAKHTNSGPEVVGEEGEADPEMLLAAEDLLRAFGAKDATAVALALKAMFELFDAKPHFEGEHTK